MYVEYLLWSNSVLTCIVCVQSSRFESDPRYPPPITSAGMRSSVTNSAYTHYRRPLCALLSLTQRTRSIITCHHRSSSRSHSRTAPSLDMFLLHVRKPSFIHRNWDLKLISMYSPSCQVLASSRSSIIWSANRFLYLLYDNTSGSYNISSLLFYASSSCSPMYCFSSREAKHTER